MWNFLKKYDVYWVAAISSILVSLIIFSWQQPFDCDAFVYFAAANAYLTGGSHAAMAVYPLPLYSILLALLSKTLHVSFLIANNILAVFLDTVIVLAFVKITSLFNASKREMYFGLLFILFLPYFAHFRHMSMRDHGYLAFALCALCFLIAYYREEKIYQSVLWGFFVILSLLFRVEGGFLLIFAPLPIIFNNQITFFARLKRLLLSYIFPIFLFIAAILFIFLKNHQVNNELFGHYFGRVMQVKKEILSGLNASYHVLLEKAQIIKPAIPEEYRLSLAIVFMMSGLVGLYFKHLFDVFPLLYFVLGIAGLYQLFAIKKQKGMAIIFGYMLICLVISFGFLIQEFFITGRYLLLSVILVLIGAPFAFNTLVQRWENRAGRILGSRWFFPLIVVWFFVIALSSLIYFGPSKAYIIKSGDWLHDNLSPGAVLCVNDKQLGFYSRLDHVVFLYGSISGDQIKQCAYFAAAIDRHDQTTEKNFSQMIAQSPVKTFSSWRGAKVIVYKLNHE